MKSGQNHLNALTDLEEIAAQLSQHNFCMILDQLLIQFLSILFEGAEKRTFCNRKKLDRKQVLLAIRSRYENLQRERGKGGGRKDAGRAVMADAGGRSDGKRYSPLGARGHGKGRGDNGRGGRRNNGDGDGKIAQGDRW